MGAKKDQSESADDLIRKCLLAHEMTLAQFCVFSGIPRSTFNTWKAKGKITKQGKILLEKFIENKKLIDELLDCRALKASLKKSLNSGE